MMSSTGAEAVEAAIKLARAATGRAGIVYARGGFHGLSLGTLSIMGAPRLRAPFEPLVPHTSAVPFGDVAALKKALASRRAAAFVVEPIQAEAGVILPPPGYLAEVRALCDAHGTLLVFDEVQTGLGRTGARFAFQGEGVVPDVLVLAKSLGGGIVPVGATLCSTAMYQAGYGSLDRFDAHGSTFAGNPLACAAVIATLDRIDEGGLAERAKALGARLVSRLESRIGRHPLVRTIRGRGLLVGIEVGSGASAALAGASAWMAERMPRLGRLAPPPFVGQWIALRMLEAGFLCQPAAHDWDVVKLAPPLTIDEVDLDRAVDALATILDEYGGAAAVLRDVGVRMAARGVKGWAW
jgi:putrescine aminotransferase